MTRSVLRAAAAALLLPALAACGGDEPPPPPDVPPQLLSESPFRYPEALWDAEVEGETTLAVWIDVNGRVDSARVVESSGHPAMDSAALAGADSLRFRPAQRGEEPVAAWYQLPVRFQLDPTAAPPSADSAR